MRKVFETPLNDLHLDSRTWLNIHIYTFPRDQKAISVKNLLKDSIKLLRSPFPVMLQTFFTGRAFKEHFGTQGALKKAPHGHSNGTPRAPGDSRHAETWIFTGQFDTWVLETLGDSNNTWVITHSGTLTLRYSKSTQALG